jgi:hypothetical protein
MWRKWIALPRFLSFSTLDRKCKHVLTTCNSNIGRQLYKPDFASIIADMFGYVSAGINESRQE